MSASKQPQVDAKPKPKVKGKARKTTFLVRIPSIGSISNRDLKEYVEEAINCWKGRKDPADPLFDLPKAKVYMLI